MSLGELLSSFLRYFEDSSKPATRGTIIDGTKSEVTGGDVGRPLVDDFDSPRCMLDRSDGDARSSLEPFFFFL